MVVVEENMVQFCKNCSAKCSLIHTGECERKAREVSPSTSNNSAMLEIAWCMRELAVCVAEVADMPLLVMDKIDAVLARLQQ